MDSRISWSISFVVSAFIILHGALGSVLSAETCIRERPESVLTYNAAIKDISDYLNGSPVQPTGILLRQIAEIIWPKNGSSAQWYCVNVYVHGKVSEEVWKNSSNVLEGFRAETEGLLAILFNSQNDLYGHALHDLHVNISHYYHTFLHVVDIEGGSLFIREFSLLLLGSHAEFVNYCKGSEKCPVKDIERWRRRSLPPTCYIMAKYTYWLLKYMPKKMSDYIVVDINKSRNTQLNFVNQLGGQVLREYIEPLSHFDINTPEGKTYPFALLKAARLNMREKLHKYWKQRLDQFRQAIFLRYCITESCRNDQYDEFAVKVADPVAFQYLAATAEYGTLCSGELCSTMWISTGGHSDYVYYRQCLGANPLQKENERCVDDYWSFCGRLGSGCQENDKVVNNQFPVLLRSSGSDLCVDCSDSASWCRQTKCPVAHLHPGYPSDPVGDRDNCLESSQLCSGPQFQIHKMGARENESIEVLDEVYFSSGGPKGNYFRLLHGGVFAGTFLRTQHYLRIVNDSEFSSVKENHTSLCHLRKSWSDLKIYEQVACARSSFTLFRTIDEEKVLYGYPSAID